VIERAISVAKVKFKLLTAMPNGFDYLMQIKLVIVAISVVNFTRHWNTCEEQGVHDPNELKQMQLMNNNIYTINYYSSYNK
jgi:hypothetical protein